VSLQALPQITVTDRERRLIDQVAAAELDAFIVTSATSSRWLTGFAGSNATVVVADQTITLFTDSRYAERAPVELASAASSANVVIERAALGAAIRERIGSASKIGLESQHVSWHQQRTISAEWLPDSTLVPTTDLIAGLRAVKDHAELARVSAAAHFVDEALGQVHRELLAEPTEREFARSLDAAIRAAGADDLGFDTIVASGPNAAIPHHSPGDRVISSGDLVIVDVGAMVDGYRSDMTRTFCVGPFTTDQRRHYETVQAAQQAGVEAMTDGAKTGAVDAAARAVIEAAGWGAHFTHGTGHGVGLDIHELPRVAKDATDTYAVGTVATVEPGVYLPGIGGVRVEDTCLVTSSPRSSRSTLGLFVSLEWLECSRVAVDEVLFVLDANFAHHDLGVQRSAAARQDDLCQGNLAALQIGKQQPVSVAQDVQRVEELFEFAFAHLLGIESGFFERVTFEVGTHVLHGPHHFLAEVILVGPGLARLGCTSRDVAVELLDARVSLDPVLHCLKVITERFVKFNTAAWALARCFPEPFELAAVWFEHEVFVWSFGAEVWWSAVESLLIGVSFAIAERHHVVLVWILALFWGPVGEVFVWKAEQVAADL